MRLDWTDVVVVAVTLWLLVHWAGCDVEYTVRYERPATRTTEPPRRVLCGVEEAVIESGLTSFSLYWAEYEYLGRIGDYRMRCPRPDLDHGLLVECEPLKVDGFTFTHRRVYCMVEDG